MPSRIIVSALAPRNNDARTITNEAVMAANQAIRAILSCALGRKIRPKTIDDAPPNAAAAEIPSVNGSARGLPRIVCICAPATLNAMPTSSAMTDMGRRSFQITVCDCRSKVSGRKIPTMTSPTLMLTGPTTVLTIKATSAQKISTAIINRRRNTRAR